MTDAEWKERKRAHAKLRETVENAVKEAMLRDGMTRAEIRQAITEVIKTEVASRMAGVPMEEVLRKLLREEITRMVGGEFMPSTIKRLLVEELTTQAKEYVNNCVLIQTNTKEMW